MLQQDGLDLAELDAEAAHLDLLVDPAEVLQLAVGQQRARGRRCGTGASRRVERIGDEALRGQFGAVRGSRAPRRRRRRRSRPARRRQRPQPRVEDGDRPVRDRRPTDARPGRRASAARDRPVVTWTVVSVIPYMLTSRGRPSPWRSNQGASDRDVQRLAAEDDAAQRRAAAGRACSACDELAERRRASG